MLDQGNVVKSNQKGKEAYSGSNVRAPKFLRARGQAIELQLRQWRIIFLIWAQFGEPMLV